jgi:hypothetical protein
MRSATSEMFQSGDLMAGDQNQVIRWPKSLATEGESGSGFQPLRLGTEAGSLCHYIRNSVAVSQARPYPNAIPPNTSLGQCASSTYRRPAQKIANNQKVNAPVG